MTVSEQGPILPGKDRLGYVAAHAIEDVLIDSRARGCGNARLSHERVMQASRGINPKPRSVLTESVSGIRPETVVKAELLRFGEVDD